MASSLYDIITVGGSLGGSALAKAMVEYGAQVLVNAGSPAANSSRCRRGGASGR